MTACSINHYIPPRSSNRCRGFTLTEIAIVLGIIGVIIGMIWAVAAAVVQNNKVLAAVQEAGYIAENYRSLYATRGMDSGLGALPVPATCNPATVNGVGNGFFPPPMGGAGCVSGDTATYPTNPWGGFVAVSLITSEQAIDVGFNGLSQASCVQFAVQIPDSSTIFNVVLPNGSILNPPITVVQAETGCDLAGNANSVQVLYKAR